MVRSLSALLVNVRQQLTEAGMQEANLEARLLVEHFTGTERKDAITSPDRLIGDVEVAALEAALSRRLAGEPVHRIMGAREFYGLQLKLSVDTLEPRPDTETLIELALPVARCLIARKGKCRILDLGTGTGAIALALLSELPEATAIGVDISDGALETAKANAHINGCEARFTTLKSDWFAQVEGEYDLIISNPPYIPTGDVETLDQSVRQYDPLRALDGGDDGLIFYRQTAASCGKHLSAGGAVAVEIGYNQKSDVIAVFEGHGFVLSSSACDFGGRDRALLFMSE